jgi:hypothetical protein
MPSVKGIGGIRVENKQDMDGNKDCVSLGVLTTGCPKMQSSLFPTESDR